MFKAAAASRVAAFRMEFAGMAPAHSDAWVCHHRMLHSHTFQGPGERLLQEGSWGRSKSKNPVSLPWCGDSPCACIREFHKGGLTGCCR